MDITLTPDILEPTVSGLILKILNYVLKLLDCVEKKLFKSLMHLKTNRMSLHYISNRHFLWVIFLLVYNQALPR